MREVHNIIRHRGALEHFVKWLPDLEPSERYFVCLQARKKYFPSLKSGDKTQLKRFTSHKDDLISKIEQLECPVGCYRTKEGEVIPDEALALYITVTPRNMRVATFSAIKSLVAMIEKGDVEDMNPHSEVLSCIHKAKGRSTFVHFDIDRKDENSTIVAVDIWNKAAEIVGPKALNLVETRGGCHLMIELSKVVSQTKNWYPIIAKAFEGNIDQTGDLMMPVVGCCQGGFTPHFCVGYDGELRGYSGLEPNS